MRPPGRGLGAWLRRFARDRRGVIALKFALAAPAVTLLTVGGVDLHAVHAAKARLQAVADAAALAGANELSLASDDEAAIERAKAFIDRHLEEWEHAPTVRSAVRVYDDGGQAVIDVALAGNRMSFFGNMLPPGGWDFSAASKAVSVGLTPLCVLITDTRKDKVANVKDQSRLSAPECLVHSNGDIAAEGGTVHAAMVRAVSSASGDIQPSAQTGAAAVDDPLSGLTLTTTAPCNSERKIDQKTGSVSLAPGVHCGDIIAAGDTQVTLQPGDHFFRHGSLIIKENASLTGVDVVLIFDEPSKFEFKDRARVNLDGRVTGALAGMVMLADRKNRQDFIITSDQVETLLGVIYVPSARLIVEGKGEVARDSAWTVIVASRLEMKGAPSLIINAHYSQSAVPVPNGVGPRGGGARLRD